MFGFEGTKRFLGVLNHIDYGGITLVTPDGKTHCFKGPNPGAEAVMILHDWRVIGAMMRHGDVALAETYRDGLWDSPDPTQLFLFGLENQSALERYMYGILGGLCPVLPIFLPEIQFRTVKKIFTPIMI